MASRSRASIPAYLDSARRISFSASAMFSYESYRRLPKTNIHHDLNTPQVAVRGLFVNFVSWFYSLNKSMEFCCWNGKLHLLSFTSNRHHHLRTSPCTQLVIKSFRKIIWKHEAQISLARRAPSPTKELINKTLWDTISETVWKYDRKMTNV